MPLKTANVGNSKVLPPAQRAPTAQLQENRLSIPRTSPGEKEEKKDAKVPRAAEDEEVEGTGS